MDYLPRPKRPTRVSQLSAKIQADQWTRHNVINTITDGDGLEWKVQVHSEESIEARKRALMTSVTLSVEASGQILVKTGTLDSQDDARLLLLIGARKINFAIEAFRFQASSGEEVHRTVSLRLHEYRKNFAKQSLSELKRKWIGAWIDRHKAFSEFNNN